MDSDIAELTELPVAARLTAQFYAWERWGRGWHVWPAPVQLEPPFTPFRFHWAPPFTSGGVDDGRKPTLLSSLFDAVAALGKPKLAAHQTFTAWVDEITELREPAFVEGAADLVTLLVTLAPEVKVSGDVAEQFLVSLAACRSPVSFEVVGASHQIHVQFTVSEGDVPLVRDQIRAHFPQAIVEQGERDVLSLRWEEAGFEDEIVVDFGLSQEFMRPIKTIWRLEAVDPLVSITGALSDLRPWECGIFQVMFQPARARWPDSVIRAVTDDAGECFFADDAEMVRLSRDKITRPLFAAVVRVAARSADRGRARQIAERLSGAIKQCGEPLSNEIVPLESADYEEGVHIADVLARQSRRSGMLLNSGELVGLVHPPSSVVQTEGLVRQSQRTKAAPTPSREQPYVLGDNTAAGRTVPVGLSWEQRVRHMHVIGAPGTGKSTLLLNLIIQDLEQGNALAVIDPHGDLVDEVLGHIPDHRIDDVVLVDPSDVEHPIGFNMLAAHSEHEKTLLASDLVAGFRRLATSWGDQMTSVLSNAVLAFLESDRGGTLLDLRRFLVEPEFRKSFLSTLRDPHVVYYWQKEFPLLQGRPQASILTRLDTFLRSRLVRNVVSQSRSPLDFASIMNDGKVLLIKLAQGAIGEENASLLGTLFIAKFHQAALGRQEQRERDRRPFYLYADEFHNFITPSMASILSGARKYRLGLILAHQDLRQLLRDEDVSSAVLANAGTRICFRVGDADAKKLAEGFTTFTADDLKNLDIGQAVGRIERSQNDFNLTTRSAPSVDDRSAQEVRERAIALSRERYASVPEPIDAVAQAPDPKADDVPAPEAFRPVRPDKLGAARERPPVTQSAAPIPPSPKAPGRGGSQHKYLQALIRRWGEDNGYRATVEREVLDGLGSVDVALERDGKEIACEICVTTDVHHELENVQKCVAAGFARVILIALDERTRRKVQQAVHAQFVSEHAEKIEVLAPEDLFSSLQRQQRPLSEPKVVRGYKVSITYDAARTEERGDRKRRLAGAILDSLKRMK